MSVVNTILRLVISSGWRNNMDYDELEEGMKLHCISEDYYGDVIKMNGVLQSDCMGWGYLPISELDMDDIEIEE